MDLAVGRVGKDVHELDRPAAGLGQHETLVRELPLPLPAQHRLPPFALRAGVIVVQESEPVRQLVEDAQVGTGLADRRRHRLRVVEHHRAVAHRQVVVLQEGRRRQHQVGVEGGVGHHLVEDDGEEILASQAAADELLVRQSRQGVRVVDEEDLDRRARDRVRVGQDPADVVHVHDSGAW